MRKQLLAISSIALLMLASCAKDNLNSEAQLPISFDTKVKKASITTGASTTWSVGDKIGIFMIDNGTTTVSEGSNNREYVTANGTTFSPTSGQALYYPVSDSKVDFISYYPYNSSITALGNYAVDVSSQSNLAAIDLLWVKSNNAGTGFNKTAGSNVPLNFDHKLSKLVILTNAGSGLDNNSLNWKNMAISIQGLNTKADFDLATGVLNNSNTKMNVSPFTTVGGTKYESIVLPATFAQAGDLKITFTIGTDTYVWTAQAGEQFEAGKEYTYSINIAKTAVVLDNVNIVDWVTVSRAGEAR
ncbi:fimbrillin family protein [Sphingobacterium rhinopitheci]|uniref:fimbrillin family protein n=1 Tax=Sphingobacterium rhinopitheci TaxID=2781960 RepID=UPI001F522DF1|nr:fimbrillin family protein [Sphingobacterium rhinopitheci]MCI0922472.1 fimbrillin family protein [Sphingobacterium rhinopitheci]